MTPPLSSLTYVAPRSTALTLVPPTPIEQLGETIADLAARIHAATYELLVMLREFDERNGRYQVVMHVEGPVQPPLEQGVLELADGGIHVSAETSRRLSCDASVVVMREGPDASVSTWVVRPARFLRRSAAHSTLATAAAASQAARRDAATPITSSTGSPEARPRSITWGWCAVVTTGWCTRVAGTSR